MNFLKSYSRYLNTRKLHPIGIRVEEQDEKIFFCSDAVEKDITNAHALITLNPFSIAINAATINFSNEKRPFLKIREGEEELGKLILKLDHAQIFGELTL